MMDDRYARLYRSFRWNVPHDLNIAQLCCARWATETPDAPAILFEDEAGTRASLSFGQLQRDANRLSNSLRRIGIRRADRVALIMPQGCEAAIAHMALYQLGAIAVPLSLLFGPDALEHRLRHSGARLAIVHDAGINNLLSARQHCPALSTIVSVGGTLGRGDIGWSVALEHESATFVAESTRSEDPAILIYTSGTTGPAKGALMPHRALIGNLSGFAASQNGFPQADAVFWSPADWAWTGGLMDALLPTLHFGRPIVAYQGRFGAERAFELMERYAVTHTFLFPTALKAMMKTVPEPRRSYALKLRAIMSAGEAVGDTVFEYGRDQLGVAINEMFGQTEVNYVVGNSSEHWPARPGSMGRPYPGHRVAVIDAQGEECPRGAPGEVAVHRLDIHGHPDPVFFLGYWNDDEATRTKFTGDPQDSWFRTGDTALMDPEGYLWYQGRSDDVFKAAGYRIGPSEVENCLLRHGAVANAAVVPKPDPGRGAIVKAYVVLAPGFRGDAALVDALQAHVRGQLAPYEYPKEIEFVDALPMTTTGKVQRRILRQREEELSHRGPGTLPAP